MCEQNEMDSRSDSESQGALARAQAEQLRCLDWLERNGHDHADAFLARLGIQDWLTEECLIMLEHVDDRPVRVRFKGEEYWLIDDMLAPIHHFSASGDLLANPFIDVSYAVIEGNNILRFHCCIGTRDDLETVTT